MTLVITYTAALMFTVMSTNRDVIPIHLTANNRAKMNTK